MEYHLEEICFGEDTGVALFLLHNPVVDYLHQLNCEILHLFTSLSANHAKVVVIRSLLDTARKQPS
jgi:hypothetical protein